MQWRKLLHEQYSENRINGEWFQFSRDKVHQIIESIPIQSCEEQLSLDRFSNIEEDRKDNRRAIRIKYEKLRGNFTTEEREEKRQAAIHAKRIKKLTRLSNT
jgi:hypothetical protein